MLVPPWGVDVPQGEILDPPVEGVASILRQFTEI